VGVLALAAYMGAIGAQLWLGEIEIAGFRMHWLTLLFALSGSLMISRIRIPKL
jgi:CDP-diacylglycerol--serine O-phosphatidyltransferase